MPTKAKAKQPSAAQLRARRKFAAAAKARAKAARAAKKAATTKARKKAPSPAQLRARKKFAAAAKARAKAARAGKRNSTNIRAKRIDHLDVSKIHNPSIAAIKTVYHQKTAAGKTVYYYYSTKAMRFIRISADVAAVARRAGASYQAKKKENPRKGTRKIAAQAKRFTKFAAFAQSGGLPDTAKAALEARDHDKKFSLKALRGQRAYAKRKNADHRDAQHPIHVTDYWQGRKGYKSQWQRAHEAGQRQLFGVKNPTPIERRLASGAELYNRLAGSTKDHLLVVYHQAKDSRGKGWQQKQTAAFIRRLTRHSGWQLTPTQANNVALYLKHIWGFATSKNGTPARPAARAANGAGSALARKRRAEFVGRPSKKTISTYAPKGSGAKPHSTLVAMGKLKKVFIKGRTPLNFNGAAILAHDPKTDKMFVLGKGYTLKHLKKNPDRFEDLGEVTRIEYETTKTHLGDETPVTYFHKLGEEGGEKPHAVINEENLLLLEGGDYYITPEGIRD